MNNKPFEQWWAGLEETDKPGCRYVKIDYRKIHMDEAEARELHAQIIEAADYPMPCTIMRRFMQMDDSPLGCYVPVAYCDHYGRFEELLEAAGKPHALICVQRQERPKPKAEPKPTEPTEATEDEDKPYIVEMRFPGEKWIERGRFDTPEEANLFTHEDGAFAPPGQREYRVRRYDEKPEPEPIEQQPEPSEREKARHEIEELTKERDELAKRLEEYGTEIAHLRSQQLDEGQRQLIIMGLADCVLNCPGFEHACREVAEHLNGVVMFDHFKVTRARYKTPPPSDGTPIPADPS